MLCCPNISAVGRSVWARLAFVLALPQVQSFPWKVKELIAALESDGWFLVRTKGSHRQFHHHSKPGTVTVSGKLSIDMPAGTLNNALKQAGLKK